MRDDPGPEDRPDTGSAAEPLDVPPPPATTPSPGDAEERDSFDVPEWVSEFRRLYVEPKTRAALKEQSARTGRRPTPAAGPTAPATGEPDTSPGQWDGPEQPLADEPLRSRSAVQRDRRATRGDRGGRPAESGPPARRSGEGDGPGTEAVGSRAALRRARQERARAERRMRLRRTVVVGVLLLVVAAVVTWLVARNQEPVSATPTALATSLSGAAPTGSPAVGTAGGDPDSTDRPTVGRGGEASSAVRRQTFTAAGNATEPAPPAQVPATRERATVTAPAATPEASPRPTPTSSPVARGTGSFSWVDWGDVPGARTSGGEPVRVALELEGGLGLDEVETSRTVARILVDERGWQRARDVRFVFVDPDQAERGDFDVRIGIASRETTDDLCAPLETDGYTSCYNGRVVVNLDRWMLGIEAYDGRLDDYRTYVVDHEVGHALGLGHEPCPRKGAPAPVMVPQTLHLWGCLPNPYPVVG